MAQLTKQFDIAEHIEFEALDKPTIAALSTSQIHQMTDEELVRVIYAADLQIPNRSLQENLGQQERGTLERMAFLARRSCRHSGY